MKIFSSNHNMVNKIIKVAEKSPIVYHGTNQEIDRFDSLYLGESTFAASALEGFFFTDEFDEALIYAQLASEKQPKNKAEYEKKSKEYERLNRMYERRGEWDKAQETIEEWERFDQEWLEDDSGKKVYAVELNINNLKKVDASMLNNIGKVKEALVKAKNEGYDGVKLEGIKDGYIKNTNHWVVFNSNQINIVEVIDIR